MANTRFAVIGVGSPIVDTLSNVGEDFLKEHVRGAKGGMEMVDSAEMAGIIGNLTGACVRAPGGAAANTTRALGMLGQPVTLLGKLGNDANAKYYQEIMAKSGVDGSRFKYSQDCPTARCLSLVTPDAQRTMRTDLAAAGTMQSTEISVTDFNGAAYAYIEGYLLYNAELGEKVFACAKAAGCKICLNCGSFEVVRDLKPRLTAWVEQYVDLLFANTDEAREFTGQTGDSKELALTIASAGRTAVVTDGARGACAARDGKAVLVDALTPKALVDTTGAGDFFAAGFMWGMLKECSLARAAYAGSILSREIIAVTGVDLSPAAWETVKTECAKIA